MKRVFLDTNILVYSHDTGVPDKRAQAQALIASLRSSQDASVISTQVLQELYNILTRKLHDSPEIAKNKLLLLKDTETVLITPVIIFAAADLHASASLSFWDALIVVAAQSAGCNELWSEDMQDGRNFGTLKIRNPFAALT